MTRNLQVVLSAQVARYTSGMTRAAAVTTAVGTAADGTKAKLAAAFNNAGGVERFAAGARKAGTALAAFSLAATAIASGAVGMSAAYDREFSKITGLVGIASDEVDSMKASTLELAGSTAQAPRDLASAMFTIQSAGLRGADGAEALEVAAKGAAAGMGQTRDIAQAMTSVMSAYRNQNITAAQAGDVLAATVRAGNFEASQLAGSLGRILPVASTLEIGIEDVGGAIALLTRNNGNAAESITAIRGVMNALLNPSSEAKTILASVGLSMADVRAAAAGPEGMVGALRLMDGALGGNREQLAKVLGRTEALGAAITILDADADTIADTFGAVSNATGVLGEAFDAAAATSSFQFQQAMTQMRVAMIQLGSEAAPLVASAVTAMAGALTSAVGTFRDLPGPVRAVVAGLAAFAALSGPMLLITGSMAKAVLGINALRVAASAASLSFGPLGVALLAVGVAVTAGVAIWNSYKQGQQEAADRATALTEVLRAQNDPALAALDTFSQLSDQLRQLSGDTDDAGSTVQDLGRAWLESTVNAVSSLDAFNRAGLSIDDVTEAARTGTDAFHGLENGVDTLRSRSETTGPAMDLLIDRLQKVADSDAPESVKRVAESLLEAARSGELTASDIAGLVDVVDESADAFDDHAKATNEDAKAMIEAAVFAGDLSQAHVDAALAAAGGAEAEGAYTRALEQLNPVMQENVTAAQAAADAAYEFAEKQKASEEAARRFGRAVEPTTASLEDVADASTEALDAAEELSGGMDDTADSFTAASDAVKGYRDVLAGMTGTQADADAAAIDYAESQYKLAAALDESNGSVGLHSQEAIGAKEAIIDAASAARDHTLAMIANGASVEEAQRQNSNYADSFRRVLEGTDLSEAAIDQLIATYLELPDEVITNAVADVEEATADVDALIALALEYGETDPSTIAEMQTEEANRKTAEALANVREFDEAEAQAALDASTETFDAVYAAALLQLAGWDAEEAAATVNGDAATYKEVMAEALVTLGLWDEDTGTATLTADNAETLAAADEARAYLEEMTAAEYLALLDADGALARTEADRTGLDLDEMSAAEYLATLEADGDPARGESDETGQHMTDMTAEEYLAILEADGAPARGESDGTGAHLDAWAIDQYLATLTAEGLAARAEADVTGSHLDDMTQAERVAILEAIGEAARSESDNTGAHMLGVMVEQYLATLTADGDPARGESDTTGNHILDVVLSEYLATLTADGQPARTETDATGSHMDTSQGKERTAFLDANGAPARTETDATGSHMDTSQGKNRTAPLTAEGGTARTEADRTGSHMDRVIKDPVRNAKLGADGSTGRTQANSYDSFLRTIINAQRIAVLGANAQPGQTTANSYQQRLNAIMRAQYIARLDANSMPGDTSAQSYQSRLNGIVRSQYIAQLLANSGPGDGVASGFQGRLQGIVGALYNATLNANANTSSAEAAINNAARDRTSTIHVRTSGGGGQFQADGGIVAGTVQTFSRGGFSGGISSGQFSNAPAARSAERHVAQIAPAGAWRVWAEEETGGEAYIPLATAKRARSLSILERVARMFGKSVVAQNNGSVLTSTSQAAAATSSSFNRDGLNVNVDVGQPEVTVSYTPPPLPTYEPAITVEAPPLPTYEPSITVEAPPVDGALLAARGATHNNQTYHAGATLNINPGAVSVAVQGGGSHEIQAAAVAAARTVMSELRNELRHDLEQIRS